MHITLFGVLAGLVLLLLPLYVLNEFHVPIIGMTVRVFSRVAAVLLLTGACLYCIFNWNHWAVNLVSVLLMIAAGMLMTLRRVGLQRVTGGSVFSSQWAIPVGAGMVAAVLVVGAWTMLLMLGVRSPLEAQFLVPVAGLLVGSIAGTLPRALRAYYSGLLHHGQLYYYLLGNGSSQAEALSWFVRRALQQSVLLHLSQLSVLFFAAAPMAMWAMLMSGVGVVEAVVVQFLLLVAMFCASVIAIVVTLYVARRYAFDAYGRLHGSVQSSHNS
ncbi:MAG: ABC transporter permease [Prevotella sp.]|nr:ABC transporter permease [Prevotella sp.]